MELMRPQLLVDDLTPLLPVKAKDGLAHLMNSDSLTWLLFASTAGIVGVGIAALSAYESDRNFALFFIWYTSLLAALIIPMVRYGQCHRLLERTKRRYQQDLDGTKIEMIKSLRRILRPRIDFCESLDSVCEMAYGLISTAHTTKVDEYRYITFYGAAHLSTPEAESEEYGTVGGSGQVSPYQRYVGAVEAATGDKVRMRRYIHLFTNEEFEKRSFAIQREYLNWLKGQHNMLSRNPNYVLSNVVRAPKWGSNVARIVTHSAMMEITGNGEAAIVLTDDHFCETIRRSARDSVIGGAQTINHPDYYGQINGCNKTLNDFREYSSGLEKILSTKTAGDEES